MAIFLTGDTHGSRGFERLSKANWPLAESPGEDDFIVVLGDCGLFFSPLFEKEDRWRLGWLAEQPWTTLFLDGNHDNFPMLNALPKEKRFGGEVGVARPGKVFHLRRGQIYTLAGRRAFVFGGGISVDRKLRREGVDWWPEEIPSSREMEEAVANLGEAGWKVDLVFTHVGPESVVNRMFCFQERVLDPVEFFLDRIREKLDFSHWFFGHYHEDVIGRIPRFTALYRGIASTGK